MDRERKRARVFADRPQTEGSLLNPQTLKGSGRVGEANIDLGFSVAFPIIASLPGIDAWIFLVGLGFGSWVSCLGCLGFKRVGLVVTVQVSGLEV